MQRRAQSATQLSPQYYRYDTLTDTHTIWKDGSYKKIKKNGDQISKFRQDFSGFATYKFRKDFSMTYNNPKAIYLTPKCLQYRKSKLRHFTTNNFFGYMQFPNQNYLPVHLQKPKKQKPNSIMSKSTHIESTSQIAGINIILKDRHSSPKKILNQQERKMVRQDFQQKIENFCQGNQSFKNSWNSISNARPTLLLKKSCYNGNCTGSVTKIRLGKKRATKNVFVVPQSFHDKQISKQNWEKETISLMMIKNKFIRA